MFLSMVFELKRLAKFAWKWYICLVCLFSPLFFVANSHVSADIFRFSSCAGRGVTHVLPKRIHVSCNHFFRAYSAFSVNELVIIILI